jgi:hypothetical protein
LGVSRFEQILDLRSYRAWTQRARVRAYTRPEIEKLFQGAKLEIVNYAQEDENVFVRSTKS